MCDQIIPAGKWKACSMVDKMKDIRQLKKNQIESSTFFKRFKEKCCVYSLHVAELPLVKWDYNSPSLQHVVEIFLAIVCYYMIVEYPSSEELSKPSKKDTHRLAFLRHLHFLEEHWIKNTTDTGKSGDFIKVVSLIAKDVSKHSKDFNSYLIDYLERRGIKEPKETLDTTISTLKEKLDFSFYDTLFEEYFTIRRSSNIIYRWGGDEEIDTAYNKQLITTHTRPGCNSCVGFVCFIESKSGNRLPEMQGIVSCPFYRAAYSNEKYALGPANTIIDYLHIKLEGKLLKVDPISSNTDWKNRLSKIHFIVDPYGNPIKGQNRKRKRVSNCLKSRCDTNSESDSDFE